MTTRLVCTHGSYNCNTVDKDGAGTVAGGVVLCCVVWAAVCDVGGVTKAASTRRVPTTKFLSPVLHCLDVCC